MARTNEEWAALLGSTLCKMARVHGTDTPDAYLPEECYRVIEKTVEAARTEARAEGYAAAMRDMQQQDRPARTDPSRRQAGIGQAMSATPISRRNA
ncbi:hypothetical protein [Shinella sp.]|uniref:hypothetical protein n=1 Tax=Shinella sp. TaxID=1870904 RepID=UPI00301CC4A9